MQNILFLQKIWKGGSETGSGQSLTSADGGSYSRGSSVERLVLS